MTSDMSMWRVVGEFLVRPTLPIRPGKLHYVAVARLRCRPYVPLEKRRPPRRPGEAQRLVGAH